jgi:predicted  nucleic acid-binding Zn-ribbon protein
MSRTHNLYRLQEIDLAIDEIRARLGEIQRILEDDSEVIRAQNILTSAEERREQTRVSLQSANGAVSSQKAKMERTETKLYSGSVTNTRELQDLQLESESLQRYLSTLEDHLLEEMLAHEEAEEGVDSAQSSLAQLLDQRKEAFGDLEKEKSQLINDLEHLESNHEAALAGLSEDDIEQYQKLRERHGGYAVAMLEGGNCSLCGLSLPESTQQRIRTGSEIVQCSQCKRILYAR